MKHRITDEELKRRLTAGVVPTPPADLAARLKAEIPDPLPGRLTGADPLPTHSRSWLLGGSLRLLAASLLLGIGVGWVTANLVQPPEGLTRDIALDGVLPLAAEPVEVLVPPRWQAERRPAPLPANTWTTCLAERARGWQFPSAAGITVLRLTLHGEPGHLLHRLQVDGALGSEVAESVITASLPSARSCFEAHGADRLTLFLEIVVGSDGRVVWVEGTAPP